MKFHNARQCIHDAFCSNLTTPDYKSKGGTKYNANNAIAHQAEIMRELDSRGIPYELHKPSGGNWADNKVRFERVTGWKGRSNPETRSAAYFGYLAVMKATKEVRKPIKVSTFSGRVEVMRG